MIADGLPQEGRSASQMLYFDSKHLYDRLNELKGKSSTERALVKFSVKNQYYILSWKTE